MLNILVIAATLVVTLIVLPAESQIYPSNKLFAPILESICYDEILDSCGNDPVELSKPGYQIYCMFCRGGVYKSCPHRNLKKPFGTLDPPNLYARLYGCFKDEKYARCAYDIIFSKYKTTLFDLTNPGSESFVALQNTLAKLYENRKPSGYC